MSFSFRDPVDFVLKLCSTGLSIFRQRQWFAMRLFHSAPVAGPTLFSFATSSIRQRKHPRPRTATIAVIALPLAEMNDQTSQV